MVAFALALVWLAGAAAGLSFAVVQSSWLLVALALLALFYGLAWLRVAVRRGLLSWSEFVAPWQANR